MIEKLSILLIRFLINTVLKFRYRVQIEGLENLDEERLRRSGGILFLPNHPTMLIDPLVTMVAIFKKCRVRPVVADYIYNAPILNRLFAFLRALEVPDLGKSPNRLKMRKIDREIDEIIEGLKRGENFLIYPAGHLKNSNREVLGGSSGVHRIVMANGDINIVLVRIKGLYGSIFSRYFQGVTPNPLPLLLFCFKELLKNFIFFMPKREVIVEFAPAGEEFPYKEGDRRKFNKYLEDWYNIPDGMTKQEGEKPGDSTLLVSYSFWKKSFPKRVVEETVDEESNLAEIPCELQKKVKEAIAELAKLKPEAIRPKMQLQNDLGFDSLDLTDLAATLKSEFKIAYIPIDKMTTVEKAIAIAAKKICYQPKMDEALLDLAKWHKMREERRAFAGRGETLGEMILYTCDRHRDFAACADLTSGVLTYGDLKLRSLLLAEVIRKLPGSYIGIFLPSSVAAFVVIFACHIAGKTPLPINWTVGIRHLKAIVELSQVKVVFSSWKFLDNICNIDIAPIEDMIIPLEDLRKKIGIREKLKALYRSKLSPQKIAKIFGTEGVKGSDTALLLFTSGTEGEPKGVPLTHSNIAENLTASLNFLTIYENDIFYNILPPFHSFGSIVCGLFPLLAGIRVALFPDPNNGKKIAEGIERWGITIFIGAPTFIKNMLSEAKKEQLGSLRLTLCGSEKSPQSLFDLLEKQGLSHTYVEGYGLTECSPVVAGTKPNKERVGVGTPLENVELMILHEESLTPLPRGERGMVVISGPNVFNGYLNKELESPFIDYGGKRWLKSGDLGRIDAEGNLIIEGRKKRFVKIGGEMISLIAIESCLQRWADALEIGEQLGPLLAVSALEQKEGRPEIALFSAIPCSKKEANSRLKEEGFSNLYKISRVIAMEKIPLLGNGKIDYKRLDSLFREEKS